MDIQPAKQPAPQQQQTMRAQYIEQTELLKRLLDEDARKELYPLLLLPEDADLLFSQAYLETILQNAFPNAAISKNPNTKTYDDIAQAVANENPLPDHPNLYLKTIELMQAYFASNLSTIEFGYSTSIREDVTPFDKNQHYQALNDTDKGDIAETIDESGFWALRIGQNTSTTAPYSHGQFCLINGTTEPVAVATSYMTGRTSPFVAHTASDTVFDIANFNERFLKFGLRHEQAHCDHRQTDFDYGTAQGDYQSIIASEGRADAYAILMDMRDAGKSNLSAAISYTYPLVQYIKNTRNQRLLNQDIAAESHWTIPVLETLHQMVLDGTLPDLRSMPPADIMVLAASVAETAKNKVPYLQSQEHFNAFYNITNSLHAALKDMTIEERIAYLEPLANEAGAVGELSRRYLTGQQAIWNNVTPMPVPQDGNFPQETQNEILSTLVNFGGNLFRAHEYFMGMNQALGHVTPRFQDDTDAQTFAFDDMALKITDAIYVDRFAQSYPILAAADPEKAAYAELIIRVLDHENDFNGTDKNLDLEQEMLGLPEIKGLKLKELDLETTKQIMIALIYNVSLSQVQQQQVLPQHVNGAVTGR